MKRGHIGLLCAGHMVTDINQGALPAMLPFLISGRHLSYAAAASLIFAANFSSSIVQPLFGYFADKISIPWIMPLGMLLAGLGLAIAGYASNYWLIFAAVAASGIGIAAFHPRAAQLANSISGEKKATGVSIFTSGGNIGFALGPILTTPLLLVFGLKGSIFLLLPVLIVSIIFITQLPYLLQKEKEETSKKIKRTVLQTPVKDEWNSFLKLMGPITCRSITFFGLNTFLPLYFIHVLNQSKTMGSAALTILLVMGAIGTLIAGRLADYYGQRNVVKVGFGILIPLLIIFVNLHSPLTSMILLIPIGLTLFAPFSPMVVLGQKYLPNHMGLASGVTLGLAVSIGGVVAPLLGWISDSYGIRQALSCLTILPVIATIIAFILPKPKVDLLRIKPLQSKVQ